MPPLPNSRRAVLDIRKIEDYCLNLEHPRGRHKAGRFRELLGLARTDADWLRNALLEAVGTEQAFELGNDQFGTRWRVDVRVTRQGRSAVIRTAWLLLTVQDAPRFLTCWVLE